VYYKPTFCCPGETRQETGGTKNPKKKGKKEKRFVGLPNRPFFVTNIVTKNEVKVSQFVYLL
jgi:hypothetical protein